MFAKNIGDTIWREQINTPRAAHIIAIVDDNTCFKSIQYVV